MESGDIGRGLKEGVSGVEDDVEGVYIGGVGRGGRRKVLAVDGTSATVDD